MTQITNATLEGRLLAQRQVLAGLLASCIQGSGAVAAWAEAFVSDDHRVQDSSEDPGAVPDPALAVEFILAEEKRMLASEARRILSAKARG